MQELPLPIQKEIIEYIVSYRHEFSLVNKEWFNCTAGQYMKLNNKMMIKDKRPSDWFKLAEKLELSSFLKLNKEFLLECQNIKCVEFKDKIVTWKIPAWLIQLLSDSPLETIYLSPPLSFNRMKDYYSLLEGISPKLKYLCIEKLFGSFIFETKLEINFPNLKFLKVDATLNWFNFTQIYQYMPNLESLEIILKEINFNKRFLNAPIFSRLKKLEINYPASIRDAYDHKVQGLFLFKFPALKTFRLVCRMEKFDPTKIPNSMPCLETLILELAQHEAISYNFPAHPFPNIKELHLEFYYRSSTVLKLNINNLPQLCQFHTNNSFEIIITEKKVLPNITKLACSNTKEFPLSCIRKYFPNLTSLAVDFESLGEHVYDVLKLCTQVTDLTLTNLNEKVSICSLPKGPFKTTCLTLSGYKLHNNGFIDWVALNFQLTKLTLDFSTYNTSQVDIKQLFNQNSSTELTTICLSPEKENLVSNPSFCYEQEEDSEKYDEEDSDMYDEEGSDMYDEEDCDMYDGEDYDFYEGEDCDVYGDFSHSRHNSQTQDEEADLMYENSGYDSGDNIVSNSFYDFFGPYRYNDNDYF